MNRHIQILNAFERIPKPLRDAMLRAVSSSRSTIVWRVLTDNGDGANYIYIESPHKPTDLARPYIRYESSNRTNPQWIESAKRLVRT